MSRYYFDLHDGSERRDEIGREIADRPSLRRDALNVITNHFAAQGEGSDGYAIVLSVRDAEGAITLTLRMVCQVDDPVAAGAHLAS